MIFLFCDNAEDQLDIAAAEGAISCLVPKLKQLNGGDDKAMKMPTEPVVEELERDICFILGLMAIKPDHQQTICEAGALPTLVSMIRRYAIMGDVHMTGTPAHTCRRVADAITNLAHENNSIKNKVRQEGGIPPIVNLLHVIDSKVQRAVAGSLRTLAFKNEENKTIIVELGALPLLIQMLRAEDPTIHYEAVGVIGNLVHSSVGIKHRVLTEGALQPVINLLSSACSDSQREAALLLGQFATATEQDYKSKIVQRGAVPPLIEMLKSRDSQLQEMAAFALGRVAQSSDNQAGICASGGLRPLLDLLESEASNLQHNSAFALYGLSDNEDNLVHFVTEGAVQRILDCDLMVQASKDCVVKTMKRLSDKMHSRILGQILYIFQGAPEDTRQQMAISMALLASYENRKENADNNKRVFVDYGALDVLLSIVTDPGVTESKQLQAANALSKLAIAFGAAEDQSVDPAPPEPTIFLGPQYVNNPTLSDITFIVEGRKFHAHRIALLASSDIFKSMFDGEYRESSAASIPIPNIRWQVFEAMMRCIYTGSVKVPTELAQELLEASDQYMLETLKRLCERAIGEQLSPDNVSAAYDLGEAYNAPELTRKCAVYVLDHHPEMLDMFAGEFPMVPGRQTSAYSALMDKMKRRLKSCLEHELRKAVNQR